MLTLLFSVSEERERGPLSPLCLSPAPTPSPLRGCRPRAIACRAPSKQAAFPVLAAGDRGRGHDRPDIIYQTLARVFPTGPFHLRPIGRDGNKLVVPPSRAPGEASLKDASKTNFSGRKSPQHGRWVVLGSLFAVGRLYIDAARLGEKGDKKEARRMDAFKDTSRCPRRSKGVGKCWG